MQQMLYSGNTQSEGKTKRPTVFEGLSPRKADNVLKGMRLENALILALESLGLEYTDLSRVCNFKNRSDQGTPDLLIGEKTVVEVKNWNCEKYGINEYLAFTEILQRFKNHMGKRKILIISNPKWEGNAKQYVKACGIEIYELGYSVVKETFMKTISDIEKLIRIALGYLYNTIFSSAKYLKKLCKSVKRVFSKAGYIGFRIQKRANQCENRQICPETIDLNREIHEINSTGFTGNARANGKKCSMNSPDKPLCLNHVSGLNLTFRPKHYLAKTVSRVFIAHGTLSILKLLHNNASSEYLVSRNARVQQAQKRYLQKIPSIVMLLFMEAWPLTIILQWSFYLLIDPRRRPIQNKVESLDENRM